MTRLLQVVAVSGALLALAGCLVVLLCTAPPAPVSLRAAVASALPASGVTHPVTAVLLNFRAYDTLLEIAVLISALLGVLAVTRPARRDVVSVDDAVLAALAQWLVPVFVLTASYLLWAGAHRPGGAFQAAALLGAAAVLAHLARLLPAWPRPGVVRRALLAGGFMVFLACAVPLQVDGVMLALPASRAGTLIFVIECGLGVSLGVLLAALFLCMTDAREPANRAADAP